MVQQDRNHIVTTWPYQNHIVIMYDIFLQVTYITYYHQATLLWVLWLLIMCTAFFMLALELEHIIETHYYGGFILADIFLFDLSYPSPCRRRLKHVKNHKIPYEYIDMNRWKKMWGWVKTYYYHILPYLDIFGGKHMNKHPAIAAILGYHPGDRSPCHQNRRYHCEQRGHQQPGTEATQTFCGRARFGKLQGFSNAWKGINQIWRDETSEMYRDKPNV
jgi:hypothetical protein